MQAPPRVDLNEATSTIQRVADGLKRCADLSAGIIILLVPIAQAAHSEWGWAIFPFVWGLGASLSDNLLRPLLISAHAPVSMLAVFVSVISGIPAFGVIGLIIGPVLLTILVALRGVLADYLSAQA